MAKGAKTRSLVEIQIILTLTVVLLLVAVPPSSARVELTPLVSTVLGVRPLDVAVSDDGKTLFVLTGKEVLIYSLKENRITKRFDLDNTFDHIRYSARANIIVLSSTKTGELRTLKIDHIFSIDVSGHPFKGRADAPVTIAVFDDYQ